MDQKFAEFDEKLSEKANKQSVAQALHRKANKPEVDVMIAKKVDFEDMQRILDAKVDLVSFNNVVRTLDFKADKHELVMASQNMSHEASFDKNELEKLFNILKQSTLETDEKFGLLEHRINQANDEMFQAIEKLKLDIVQAMQQKPEFQDLEIMAHKLNTKAD